MQRSGPLFANTPIFIIESSANAALVTRKIAMKEKITFLPFNIIKFFMILSSKKPMLMGLCR